MIFTNQIASVVHRRVHKSGGSVNKNIGDAFLAVWKVEKSGEGENSVVLCTDQGSYGEMKSSSSVSMADRALQAFVMIRELLKTSSEIQELNKNKLIQEKLPGYTVRMGYGLHFGWAIEGAVGSKYKVDATYLSPHVNMASRLEAASKQYGVQLLMSGPFVRRVSPYLRDQCRPVDCVTVKGSNVPIMLYTHLPSELASLDLPAELADDLFATANEAFHLYKSGSDWQKAQMLLRKCLDIFPGDMVARKLLSVMDGQSAPTDWPGYRALTEK